MRKDKRTSIEIPADIEEFGVVQAFIGDLLKHASVSQEIVNSTSLIFEAVFNTVLMQQIDRSTMLRISAENRLGSIYLKIGYEGKRFMPSENDDMLPELRVLEGYADKISYSYRTGYNIIRISVRKSQRGYFLLCGSAIPLAIVVYAIVSMFMGPEEQRVLLDNYVFPFERLFANAMLMVGAPVTFFSILKNASDAVVISERVLNVAKLHVKSIATSVFAVLLALGLSVVLWVVFSTWRGYDTVYAGAQIKWEFADAIASMVPADVFEPFRAVSPIPLIVVALLVTYGLISAGRDFDVLKVAIDACYGLFARMLGAVMAALPAACFLAILDVLLGGGFVALAYMLARILFFIVSTWVLLATYAIRLKAKGVKIGAFVKKLLPLLRENHAIGSAIDAAPYNVRYCARYYGMDRAKLSLALPVLAQTNRDGNCFLLMFVATVYIFASGTDVSPVHVLVIAALVLFLSFGAPNQPGSILIGTLIIISYLNSYDIICMAICLEVFLGSMQNMVNVIGDIVLVAEEQGVRYEK